MSDTFFDGEIFGETIVAAVRSYVDRTVNARCAALEAQIALLRAELERKNFAYVALSRNAGLTTQIRL